LKALVAVVAGGAGMIGSSLCETLLRKGHEVICLDNLSTGRLENVEPLSRFPGFHFIHHDVTRDLPELPGADRVYHLASPASPVGYSRLPIETMLANSEGTRRLIGLARQHGGRFLFCSTSEIYGDPQVHPQTETYRGNVSSIGPRATYDESKRYGEAMTMAYVRSYGLDGRIVRIFNTYGPHADVQDGRVVVNFIGQALRGEAMTIYGDGMQTRSLCYVSDLVDGLIAVMESERARGEVMNLGNPDEHTVLEIAEIVRSLTQSSSRFVFTPPAVGDDPRVRRPNIDKARSLIGWQPTTPLEDGLRVMIRAMGGTLNGNGKGQHAAEHANGVRDERARQRPRDERAWERRRAEWRGDERSRERRNGERRTRRTAPRRTAQRRTAPRRTDTRTARPRTAPGRSRTPRATRLPASFRLKTSHRMARRPRRVMRIARTAP
jgi:dTDP-glucose 4,6-dehydratase/UDP-glucuronate decarboxylase